MVKNLRRKWLAGLGDVSLLGSTSMQTPQHDELRRTLCCAARSIHFFFSDGYLIGVVQRWAGDDETASSLVRSVALTTPRCTRSLMSKKIWTDLSSPQIIRKLGFNSTFSNGGCLH